MLSKRLLGVASLAFLSLSSCDSSSSSKRLLFTLLGNTGKWIIATHVAYSADGKLLASCYIEDGSHTGSPRIKPSGIPKEFDARREVKVWDAFTGTELLSIHRGDFVRAIAFFPNTQNLAVASGNAVRIWDTTTGKEKLSLNGHTDVIHDLDISRDGKWLATASLDGTIKIWDARKGNCLHTLRSHPKGVLYVSFSPDGKQVADSSGRRDREGVIRIWNWNDEKQVLSLPHDTCFGKALFSPDGDHLACHRTGIYKSWKPGLIEVWNIVSGELIFCRESHTEEVTSIAYSPGGAFLAGGEEDGTLTVRDGLTGEEILKLATHRDGPRHHEPVTSIAFSPRGDRLATSCHDGSVKIWDIKNVAADEAPR